MSVLVLVRGDLYRSFRGESTGEHIEDQMKALKSLRKYVIGPLLCKYVVTVVIDCNCLGRLHEIANEHVQTAFDLSKIKIILNTPEERPNTQHDSIKGLIGRNDILIREHNYTVIVRADLHYDKIPYPETLPNDKVIAMCPHIYGSKQANDIFWVCPQKLYKPFLDYHTNSKYKGKLLNMPDKLPIEYTTTTRYGASHEWFNPFYHYVGRIRVTEEADLKGNKIRKMV
jgi:hypothetical protein